MNTQTANYIELVASTAKNRMSSPIFTLKAIKAYVSDFRAVETTPLKEVSEVDFDKVNESLSALIELRTKAAFAACCDALMGEAQSAREANTIALRVNTVISEASKLGISVTSAQVLSTKAARDEKYFSVAVALAEVKKMAKKAKSTKLVSTAAFLMALTGAVAPAQAADQWSAIYGDVNNAFTEASGPNYSRAHDILSHRMGQDFNLDQIKHLASMMHIRAIGPYDINSTVISKLGTNTMKPTVIATALTAAIAVSAPAHAAYDATQARFAPQFAIYDQGFKTLLAGGTKTPLEVFNEYHIALGSIPGLSGDAINKHLETLGLRVVNGAVTYTDPNAPVVRNAKDMPSFADAQKNIDTANTANMGASKFDGKHVKTTSTAAVVSTIHDTTDHKLNIAHHADDSSLIANTITANSNASIIVTPPAYTAPTPSPVATPVVATKTPATPFVTPPAVPAKPVATVTKSNIAIPNAPVVGLTPKPPVLKGHAPAPTAIPNSPVKAVPTQKDSVIVANPAVVSVAPAAHAIPITQPNPVSSTTVVDTTAQDAAHSRLVALAAPAVAAKAGTPNYGAQDVAAHNDAVDMAAFNAKFASEAVDYSRKGKMQTQQAKQAVIDSALKAKDLAMSKANTIGGKATTKANNTINTADNNPHAFNSGAVPQYSAPVQPMDHESRPNTGAAQPATVYNSQSQKVNDHSQSVMNTKGGKATAAGYINPPVYKEPTPQPVPVVAPAAPSVNVPATPVVASVASLTPATPAKPAEPTKLYNVINAAPVAPLAPTKIALKPAAAPAYETVNPVHNQLTSSTDLTGFVINPQTDNDSHTTTIAKDLVKPPVYVAPTPTPVSSGIPTKAVVNVPAQPVVAPAAIVAPATPAPAAIPQPKPYATGTVIVDHLPGKLILKADNLPQIDGFGSTSTTVAKPVVDSMNIAHNNPTGAPTPVKTPVATPTPAPLTITVDKSVNSVQSGGVVNPYTPVKTQPVTIQTIQDPDQVVTITKQDPVVATSVVAASQPVVLTTSNSPTPVTPTKAPVAQANTVNTTAPVLTVAPTTTAQAQPTTTPAVVTPPAYTAPVPTPIGSGVPSATQAAANQASAQAATPTAPTTPTTPAATTPATNTAATTPAATTPTATPAAQPATQTAQTQPTAQPAATPAPVATTAPVATAQTPAPAPASTIGANAGPSVVTSTPANTGAYAQQQAAMQQAAINANSQALHNVANQVDANTTALNAQGAQLDNLESSTNKRFSDLKSQVQKNRKQASQGVANVAAMANIPQVTDDQDFTVGAGVGAFDGQAGVAVGMSARISHSVTTKASVGIGSTGGATIGAGIAYGF